jgi:hypothetical protein
MPSETATAGGDDACSAAGAAGDGVSEAAAGGDGQLELLGLLDSMGASQAHAMSGSKYSQFMASILLGNASSSSSSGGQPAGEDAGSLHSSRTAQAGGGKECGSHDSGSKCTQGLKARAIATSATGWKDFLAERWVGGWVG